MARVKYIGSHDAVDLVGHGTVKRGATVAVTAHEAASLGAQADWQRVADPKPPTAKKKPAAGKNGPAAEKTEE